MKIYIIMRGHYSDKHICGVAVDPELAEIIRQKCSDPEYDYDTARIEEYDTEHWNHLAQGGKLYRVNFYQDGRIECKLSENDDYSFDEFRYRNKIHETYIDYHEKGLSIDVIALGEAHAKKIACDKRAEYLAGKEDI